MERESKKLIESSTSKEFSTVNAGIAGIVRKQEREIQAVDAIQKSALSDLDALMKKAGEVVNVIVIQKYTSFLKEWK